MANIPDLQISEKQAETIAKAIAADIFAYCQSHAAAFEEYKKTLILKENENYETKSNRADIRKSCS